MKHNYLYFQRSVLTYLIAVWLVTLSTNLSFAQQQRAQLDAGIVRIKVTEQLAKQLESARITRSANNDLVTGIKSLDLVNAKYKATAIKRVFRDAGKFESKHRKYGLHLWYEIQLDKAAPILAALGSYKEIQSIVKAEPSYKKAIIGSDDPNFGPFKVQPSDVSPPTLPGPSNDPMLGSQWHYNNTGQAGGTPGSDISLFQAWGLTTGTPNVIIGVTDGGAQVDHPDLAANMWVNVDEIPGNGLDDDDNGFVDDINGYGFGDDTGEIAPDDHGSHTSGTIAAVTNNGVGVAGVAGGSGTGDGARIMTLAAFGGVSTGGFAESYIYGADNGAVISQNSWGYTSPGVFEQAVLDAIDYFIAEAGKDNDGNQTGPMRGGIVIFAAGNADSNEAHYPGFYEPTLAVGAVNNQDKKAWYSNFGEWVDIAAPGGETFVANDPHGVLSTIANGQYAFFQGTSMACPHVSGVAALIVSKFGGPGFTPEMLRGRLTQLADDIDAADPAFAGLLGSGRLNAFSSLQEDDGDAPAAITDLAASNAAITSITLSWTSPADPGNGSASVYDIRYSTSPITEGNFASATAVVDPPAPLPAGGSESLIIPNLAPGTTYYFAIKSADFFGNYSDISNVLQQATNFPPIISVSPTSLTETLETAETSNQSLIISNTGLGILYFTFEGDFSDGVVVPSPDFGSVPPGGSVAVNVAISANGLLPGVYERGLIITNNDPFADSLLIPVTLTVTSNGQPIATVTPEALDFGQVFETGSKTLPITIHNAGAEPLIISGISSDNGDFTTDFVGPDSLNAFEDRIVYVKYIASALGVSSGALSISTNDPDNSVLPVAVTGEGVEAPSIAVSPASLSESLNTDKLSTQTLTISNSGGSNLEFAIEVSAAASPAIAATAVRDFTVPVK